MVTTTPNALTQQTHPDRMPMILDPEDYDTWLTAAPDKAFALIRPFPAECIIIHQSGEGFGLNCGGMDAAAWMHAVGSSLDSSV